MENIYTRVIWDELKMEGFKLNEDWEKSSNIVLDWAKEQTHEKLMQVFEDLSWITDIQDEGYYDGQFHGFNQREYHKRVHLEDGTHTSDIVIHDLGMEATLLWMCIKTGQGPSSLRFMADLLEIYYEKRDKQGQTARAKET